MQKDCSYNIFLCIHLECLVHETYSITSYNDTRFLSKTQLIMINQSNARRFDPKVFVNCVQGPVRS